MSNQTIISVKIGGQAGQGVKSEGLLFAKVATRSGYYIHTYTEYPSLIRGGHNVMQILFSREEVRAPIKRTDFLIALNQDTITRHISEIPDGGGILYDSEKDFTISKGSKNIRLYPVPLAKFAAEAGGKEILINTVAVGALIALIGGDITIVKTLLEEEFLKKGESIIKMNHKAAQAGYEFAKEQFADKIQPLLTPQYREPQMIVNGTEAVALGAIAAGMQFASIYPMTPITNILAVLALQQEKFAYIYKQPEDEISAINMAIGASFTGARSLVATSGGGFCLMTEGYGLAAMTETPLVIIEGMRPGPATGLPTWTAQGDLQFILHAHQGDFPRIVLSPGDGKEAFELTMQAFNLADKYQTPVIVLIDKNICEDDHGYRLFDTSSYTIDRGKLTLSTDANYSRYAASDDGISPRSLPGLGNFFIGNSNEHTDKGYDSEEAEIVRMQVDKRMKKQQICQEQDMTLPKLYGPENAEVTVISWGSTKGSILQALEDFPNVNFLHVTWMSPFPTSAVRNALIKAKHVLDIESNYTAQFAHLVMEHTGYKITDTLLKYDGRPFFPEEISEKLQNILKK